MKNVILLVFCLVIQCGIVSAAERSGFRKQEDVAQYGGADYANVVHVARNISLEEAFDIAEKNPEIGYFIYMKGYQMVLVLPSDVQFDRSQDPFGLVTYTDFIYDSGENSRGYCRIFRHGDVVFFKNDGMWLGSATGLADAYFKE